jgi:hypothetical protein
LKRREGWKTRKRGESFLKGGGRVFENGREGWKTKRGERERGKGSKEAKQR